MQRKIARIVLFFALSLLVFSFGGRPSPDFPETDPTVNNLQQGESAGVSLIAVGDISYSRGVEKTVNKQKDLNYPFLKVLAEFKRGDLVFGNLETPITPGREISDFEMIFRSNPGTGLALKKAGFSVLSLANNHTPNFGEPGLYDTFGYLKRAGILYVGAGKNAQEAGSPAYIETKGMKFAFLSYNDPKVVPAFYEAGKTRAGTAFMRKKRMIEAVEQAKQKADFVIVSMHAGTEYAGQPNDSQKNFARAAIDAGADLIIGHHPHVVQAMEKYKGKFIFYSLGNFVFDPIRPPEAKEGLMLKACFAKDGISKIALLPIIIENSSQPRIANSNEQGRILQKLKFPLANRALYFWNSKNNKFDKGSMPVVYVETPKSKTPASKQKQADLDQNSTQETYTLTRGRLTVIESSKIIWKSPADWRIDDFVLADSNNDGILDLNLSLWKAGNFGKSKPFWVKKNDKSVKNHFFIFDLVAGGIKPIWGSSNLGAPNCEFKIADIDNDRKNDLIVVEGDYSKKQMCNGSHVAVWKWNGWGFSNAWRSGKGKFSNLEMEENEGNNRIIVDSF